jgi:death on curing protein
MRYLTLLEILDLHDRVIQQSGGRLGIRDLGLLESATKHRRRSGIEVTQSSRI